MAPNGKVCKGKWFVTLHDVNDMSTYIDNGIFLWTKDANGGWLEMESRLSLGNLKMLGETCPKDNSVLQDKLKWRQADLAKKGHHATIPTTYMTFTEMLNYLVEKKLLPAEPDPNFTSGKGNEPVVHAPDVQPAQIVELDEAGLSPSLLHSQEIYTQQIDAEIDMNSQTMYEQQFVYDESDLHRMRENESELAQLREENERLTTKISALENDKKRILEKNIQLEEEKSAGQTTLSGNLLNSLKGVLDSQFQNFAHSMETNIRREMRASLSGSSQLAHLLEQSQTAGASLNTLLFQWILKFDKVKNCDPRESPVNSLSNFIHKLNSKVMGMDNVLQKLVRDQAQNQDSLTTVVQLSHSMKRKLDSPNEMGRVSTPSLDDSGFQETPNKKPLKSCTFCLKSGHGYENCAERPFNHKCFRCHRINHREANCLSLKYACTYCKNVGHDIGLHYLTGEAERCQVMKDFGIENFSHYLSGAKLPPQKTLGIAPRQRSRRSLKRRETWNLPSSRVD